MVKQLFGTDGIRGIPGEYPLDDATIERVGFALGEHLVSRKKTQGARPRVLIGRDTRESGPHIAEQIARGLAASGAEAVSAGVLTTPGVAWLVSREGFDAGVVISASHNPYHDNGVKLISSLGMKFPDAEEAAIEGLIFSENGAAAGKTSHATGKMSAAGANGNEQAARRLSRGAARGDPSRREARGNENRARLRQRRGQQARAAALSLAGRKRDRHQRCARWPQHQRRAADRCIPKEMQKRVVETGAALGVAFDGDADRAIFSSATGRLVDGDGVLLAAGRFLKSTGKLKGGAIVGTTMANLGLERALEKSGLKLVRTAVGDRYVLEEMQRIGANLGGEQSGHILFLDDATTGDGMLTALKIASLVAIAGPLDALVADLKIFPQKIVNVKVKSKPPLESLPEVARTLKKAEEALGKSGRVVLRYSGTEPLARVMVEAERPEDVERWTEALAAALRTAIGI